ncbi:MAG: hypothetical protein GX102_05200 [Porphyromonadaceae bacterium]|jgi:hypothetical protein|nr:hypothetical protein [Porphyromonadaceae bacterium]
MLNKNIFIAVILLISAAQLAVGQNNTNSPYTVFGFGELSEGEATELRGMGGVGIGNRSKNTINVLNPASHSSVDSLTFMFDVGAGTRYSRFSDNNSSSQTFNANLEYLTLRFPVSKWLGFSAGLLPYSFVGYNFYQSDSIQIPQSVGDPRKVGYIRSYNGSGGVSQLYGGLSVKFLNHIALGVNTYYMFGDAKNDRSLVYSKNIFPSSHYKNSLKVSDVRFRYGLQLYNTFAEKHHVSLGVIYENKSQLKGTFTSQLNRDTTNLNKGFELPQVIGAGINYTFDKKLTVGVDFLQQNWGDVLFFNKKDSLLNRTKIAVGAEYMINPSGRKLSDRLKYRVGFNTSNQYYKVDNQAQPNDFVVSFGVGIPTRTGKSWINTALEYGKIGTSTSLREDYLKFTLSASIDEIWFFKPKL